MKMHANNAPDTREYTVSNKKSQMQMQGYGGSSLEFVDSRPEAITQQKIGEKAKNNPKANQITQLQATADHFTTQQQHPIQKKANNTGLPDNLKSGMEHLSGYSMDDVKVHYNSDKPAQLQAHAYAQGTNIHLAPGQEKHLAHEAWHVVQQKQGRVPATKQFKGRAINDSPALEREADMMGAHALKKTNHKAPIVYNHKNLPSNVTQRRVGVELELPIPIDKYPDDLLTPPESDILNPKRTMLHNALRKNMGLEKLKIKASKTPEEAAPHEAELAKLEETYTSKGFNVKDQGLEEAQREIREKAVPGYTRASVFEFGKWVKIHLDKDPAIVAWVQAVPPKALSTTIVELVIETPVSTIQELDEAFKEIDGFIAHVNAITNGMRRRGRLKAPYSIGPPSIQAGSITNLDRANMQVNIGIETRVLHQAVGFILENYPSHREASNRAVETSYVVTRDLMRIIRDRFQDDQKASQKFNGIEGLLQAYALLLATGKDARTDLNSLKNFTPLLPKVSLYDIYKTGLTPKEREVWEAEFPKIWPELLSRLKRAPDEYLIQATKMGQARKNKIKVEAIKNDYKTAGKNPISYVRSITDQLGPTRATTDRVPHPAGLGRRSGGVFELRHLGNQPRSSWKTITQRIWQEVERQHNAEYTTRLQEDASKANSMEYAYRY